MHPGAHQLDEYFAILRRVVSGGGILTLNLRQAQDLRNHILCCSVFTSLVTRVLSSRVANPVMRMHASRACCHEPFPWRPQIGSVICVSCHGLCVSRFAHLGDAADAAVPQVLVSDSGQVALAAGVQASIDPCQGAVPCPVQLFCSCQRSA